jgi:DNA-directed RNA polymerase specialized sigma24 family protein
MTSLESLVHHTREGDDEAYETIVRWFQDMAVGYGYSILRDFQLAEDAAQEAFLEAYRNPDKLREPAAFPGWFRRIVFKQCDRVTRDKSFITITAQRR